jgi:ABC-type molybdenum transport system ATPase subunit/photorepair protein PhrA
VTAAWKSPLTKVDLFAGQNNAGKSNLLRLAATHLHQREMAFDMPQWRAGSTPVVTVALACRVTADQVAGTRANSPD